MKKNFIFLNCILLTTMIIFGCKNIFQPPTLENQNSETGYFSLNFTDSQSARTIMPSAINENFNIYTIEFFRSGTTESPALIKEVTNETFSSPVSLNVGTWDIYVKAFFDTDKTNLAAQGNIKGIEIIKGETVNKTILLTPAVISSSGTGTFNWEIDFPANVEKASMTITPMDTQGGTDEQTVDFVGGTDNKGKQNSLTLNVGYYHVVFELYNSENQSVKRREILHIYKDMESVFAFDFTENYFISTLECISAAFSPTAIIIPGNPINDLKADLNVVAHYSNNTYETIAASDYTLSGTLETQPSFITVIYTKDSVTKMTNFMVNLNKVTPVNVNGFHGEEGTYEIVEYNGRQNVIKVDGTKVFDFIAQYSLASYERQDVTIDFSVEIMREGGFGDLAWILNLPEVVVVTIEPIDDEVWNLMSGELNNVNLNIQDPVLYIPKNEAETATYYIFNPTVTIVQNSYLDYISAVYTKTGIVTPDTLIDDLKPNITTTAHYSNNTTENIPSYNFILSGELTVPISTITVIYNKDGINKTTTFDIEVSPIPELTGTVSITGTAKTYEALTANTDKLNGNGIISYQWKRGTESIGENSSMYVPKESDVGATITVTVTREGYSGSITSTPTTAVTSEILNGVNVLDYGAVPDDNNDDADAIQSAIDAANEGETVYIPNGTYIVTNQIRLKSGIIFKGESRDGVCLEIPLTDQYIGDGNGSYSVLEIPDDSNNIEIANITIFGNDGSPVDYVIHMLNAKNIKIHHVSIRNFKRNSQTTDTLKGIFAGYGNAAEYAKDVEVSNCIIDSIDPTYDGVGGIQFMGYHTGIIIKDNIITNVGGRGVGVYTNCSDVIIQGNSVTGMYYITPDGLYEGLGVEVWGFCSNVVVEDNEMDYWLSIDNSSYVAVRNNKVGKKNGRAYVALESAGFCTNNVFTGNELIGTHEVGIGIWGGNEENENGTSYSYFDRNSVSDMTEYGVLIATETNKGNKYLYFKDCYIGGTKKGGRLDIGSGIGFWNTNDHITFDNCNISNNAGYGVIFQDWTDINLTDHLSFVNCIINNNEMPFSNHSAYTAFEFVDGEISGNYLSNDNLEERPFNNEKPTAVIKGPDSGSVGQQLSFSSASSDPDGTIEHLLWDLDDGIPLNGNSVTHTYNKAGTYKVSLIVWDQEGRGNIAEKTVVIR